MAPTERSNNRVVDPSFDPGLLGHHANWHGHTRTALQCEISVHVDADEEGPAVTCPDLVVRCDGFLLVPKGIYDRFRDNCTRATVSVPGAEGESISPPRPVAGWRQTARYRHRMAEGIAC